MISDPHPDRLLPPAGKFISNRCHSTNEINYLANIFSCDILCINRRGSGNNNCDNNATATDKDVDNFLVCVFNVSSKVSYSILQVGEHESMICYA